MLRWYQIVRNTLLALVALAAACAHAEPPAPIEASAEKIEALFPAGEEIALFDAKTLKGWKIADKAFFQHHGDVTVQEGSIILEAGHSGTGIAWTKPLPRMNYELQLEAKRVKGNDFFCGLTFPYAKSYVSLIVGGWGGGATGLSNVDDSSAVENETSTFRDYRQDQWYAIRLRVTEAKIEAWIDDDQIIDLETKDRRFSIWWEQEAMRPLGIATWYTKAALRNIRLTRLDESSR